MANQSKLLENKLRPFFEEQLIKISREDSITFADYENDRQIQKVLQIRIVSFEEKKL
jgi:hypothetical protein